MFHLVCISLGTTGFAFGFLFLGFGLWCLFGFLLCFLVRCLGNFDLIFILIPLLTDNVTHSSGNAGKKIFSGSGSSLPIANPFAAAMASLGPIERYESLYMGADEFLNRRVNEELQRAFEAGIPSSEVHPSAEIYHIGTPSERLTSEGFRSAVSHGTSSIPSHPTSSPVSFGPSTPVQSASAAPARLLSSPGGMSDVAGTLTSPGLPLRDPRSEA